MKVLTYIGEADFGYPLYKDEDEKLWANINMQMSEISGLHSLTGNDIDGEPNYSLQSIYDGEVKFVNEPDPRERAYKGDYMLLDRLRSDCEYFLGYGNRNERHLWAGNVDGQIAEMRKIWNKFPNDLKPQWLTMEQINEYEQKMKEV